jgi:geranylgeranyl reductase family protein
VRACDVAIVGAGPAGCAAAITLARAGRAVTMFDKATFPRDKCCGDGLTAGALRWLESLGLDPASIASWFDVDEFVLCAPSGRAIRYPLPRDGRFAAVARRMDLDAALVELAEAAGVDVVQDATVADVHQDHEQVTVRVRAPGTTVSCDHVIAADGMWSSVRKALGVDLPGYLGEWHAFRQYWTGVSGRAERELWVLFEPDLLPGYFWSFPLGDGRANVGFGILRGGRVTTHDMKALWPELLERPAVRALLGPDATPEGPHRAWPIPARVSDVVLTDGRVLFVGDAAAATDPMTGEGIGQALATGVWAAEAILQAGRDAPEVAAARYEEQVRRELSVDHRLAAALCRALASPRVAELVMSATALNDWTRRNFARWMFEDYPRAILATPQRWHRGMLTGSGAYQR